MNTLDALTNSITQMLVDWDPLLGTSSGFGRRGRGAGWQQQQLQGRQPWGGRRGSQEEEDEFEVSFEFPIDQPSGAPLSRRQQKQMRRAAATKPMEESKEAAAVPEEVVQAPEAAGVTPAVPLLKRMPLDILAHSDMYEIIAELPGFSKEHVKLAMRPGGLLTICACVGEETCCPAHQKAQVEKVQKKPILSKEASMESSKEEKVKSTSTSEPSPTAASKVPQEELKMPESEESLRSSVSAESSKEKEPIASKEQQPQVQYVRQERVVAPVHRVVKLPTDANLQSELIQAKCEYGLLKICVPRIPREKLESHIEIA